MKKALFFLIISVTGSPSALKADDTDNPGPYASLDHAAPPAHASMNGGPQPVVEQPCCTCTECARKTACLIPNLFMTLACAACGNQNAPACDEICFSNKNTGQE